MRHQTILVKVMATRIGDRYVIKDGKLVERQLRPGSRLAMIKKANSKKPKVTSRAKAMTKAKP